MFTAIDPAWPFAELVEPVAELTGHLPWAEAKLEPAGTAVHEFAANWMLYCDHYLEQLQLPLVNPQLAATVELDRSETRTAAYGSAQILMARPGQPTIPAPEGSEDEAGAAAMYFFLFPNILLNVYPWGLSLNIVEPLAVDRTRVRFEAWVWAPELYDTGAGSRLAQIEREDEAIVLRAQAGIASRMHERGRYAPTRELGVHHFHRLLARGWNRQFAG